MDPAKTHRTPLKYWEPAGLLSMICRKKSIPVIELGYRKPFASGTVIAVRSSMSRIEMNEQKPGFRVSASNMN